MGHQGKTQVSVQPQPRAREGTWLTGWHLSLAFFYALQGGDSRVAGGTTPLAFGGGLWFTASACRDGGRVSRIFVLCAHFAVRAINIFAVTGGTHPHLRGQLSHGVNLFGRQLWRPKSLGTFVDDSLELWTARATSNKCEVGMAQKHVSAC